MAPFMTDFVAEWRLGFSAEQASYRSSLERAFSRHLDERLGATHLRDRELDRHGAQGPEWTGNPSGQEWTGELAALDLAFKKMQSLIHIMICNQFFYRSL